MTLKLIEDQLHVNRETTGQALLGDVAQTTSSCVKFLAHSLNDEQKQHRIMTVEDSTPGVLVEISHPSHLSLG